MTPQELKESILWNAIQGKITTQDPRESVSDVLGKTRITPVAEEDAYFEIPGNWCLARIGEIFDLVNGKAFKPTDWSESGIPIVRIQNLNDPNASYNYFSGEIEEKFILHGGELLFSWSGTPGTSFGSFIWNGGHAVLNQHIFIVYPKIKLDYEYAKYALNGELRIFIAKAHGGAGLKHITRKEFDSCFLPIPPLAEQKRIVAKIEELLPLIERYEKAWSRLEDFNKRFPGDIQKSILQMAIHGKLVEQRTEEGTGEELYQQIQSEKQALIKAGKIKKEKPLPEITEDEIPFEIPERWKWVRLSNLASAIVDCPHSTPHYHEQSTDYVAIDTNCIDADGNITGWRYVDEETYRVRISRLQPILNDIVYTREGSICRAAILPANKVVCLGQRVMLIRCPDGVLSEYIKMILMAPQTVNTLTVKQKGIGAKHVNVADVCNLLLPLPPTTEQERIIAKLELLMPLCRRLK